MDVWISKLDVSLILISLHKNEIRVTVLSSSLFVKDREEKCESVDGVRNHLFCNVYR